MYLIGADPGSYYGCPFGLQQSQGADEFDNGIVWDSLSFPCQCCALGIKSSNWLTIPADTVLVLVGITITTIAILNIRTFQRMSGLQTDKLITDGIYAWSRNPQNLGWGLAMFGIAIIGHFGLALLLSALFGLAVHLYIVVLEEPYLESIYGEYRAKAARYFSISVDG